MNSAFDGVYFWSLFLFTPCNLIEQKKTLSEQTVSAEPGDLWIHTLKKTAGSLKQFNKTQTDAWKEMGVKIKRRQSSEKTRHRKTRAT